jgi:hypothetical protein
LEAPLAVKIIYDSDLSSLSADEVSDVRNQTVATIVDVSAGAVSASDISEVIVSAASISAKAIFTPTAAVTLATASRIATDIAGSPRSVTLGTNRILTVLSAAAEGPPTAAPTAAPTPIQGVGGGGGGGDTWPISEKAVIIAAVVGVAVLFFCCCICWLACCRAHRSQAMSDTQTTTFASADYDIIIVPKATMGTKLDLATHASATNKMTRV